MDKYQETFDTWNNLAWLYQEKFMELALYNDSYDYFCKAIEKPCAKILEVGCGPGNISKYLLSKRPDFDLFGIDIAPNMIKLAQENNPSGHFSVMDSRDIHTLNTTFDGIISGFCLPYLSIEESHQFIASTYDLLEDNGCLYLSFVEGSPSDSNYKTGTAGRVYFYYHSLADLQNQLIKCRFSAIEVFKVKYKTGDNTYDEHTILTAKKKVK